MSDEAPRSRGERTQGRWTLKASVLFLHHALRQRTRRTRATRERSWKERKTSKTRCFLSANWTVQSSGCVSVSECVLLIWSSCEGFGMCRIQAGAEKTVWVKATSSLVCYKYSRFCQVWVVRNGSNSMMPLLCPEKKCSHTCTVTAYT